MAEMVSELPTHLRNDCYNVGGQGSAWTTSRHTLRPFSLARCASPSITDVTTTLVFLATLVVLYKTRESPES
jgi:hypothetical protein